MPVITIKMSITSANPIFLSPKNIGLHATFNIICKTNKIIPFVFGVREYRIINKIKLTKIAVYINIQTGKNIPAGGFSGGFISKSYQVELNIILLLITSDIFKFPIYPKSFYGKTA